MEYLGLEDLTETERNVIREAEKARDMSMNSSGVFVGAAALSLDGSIVSGTRMENREHGFVVCAERAALARRSQQGIRKLELLAISVRGENPYPLPCNTCKQHLHEFAQESGRAFYVLISRERGSSIWRLNAPELVQESCELRSLGVDLARYRR